MVNPLALGASAFGRASSNLVSDTPFLQGFVEFGFLFSASRARVYCSVTMKIKVLSRNEQRYTRERPTDIQRVQRNAAPELHPFERARECLPTPLPSLNIIHDLVAQWDVEHASFVEVCT